MSASHSLTYALLPILLGCCLLSGCEKQDKQTQGYMEADYTYIAPQVGGQLQTLNVHRGQTIQQGQKLFQLNPSPENYQADIATAQLQQAQAQLNNLLKGARSPEIQALLAKQQAAQADVVYTTKALARQKAMRKNGYTSEADFNIAQQDYQKAVANLDAAKANIINAHLQARSDQIAAAQAAVQAAEHNLQQIRWQLKQKTIASPYKAIVEDTYFTPFELVNAGQPVLSLLKPDAMYAIFYVSTTQRQQLHLGQSIRVQANQSHTILNAHITYINPQASYTPPLIYSENNMDTLTFEIHAKLNKPSVIWWPGQPVLIDWSAHAR